MASDLRISALTEANGAIAARCPNGSDRLCAGFHHQAGIKPLVSDLQKALEGPAASIGYTPPTA